MCSATNYRYTRVCMLKYYDIRISGRRHVYYFFRFTAYLIIKYNIIQYTIYNTHILLLLLLLPRIARISVYIHYIIL